MKDLIERWVLPNAKAWVSAGVTALVAWLGERGVLVPEDVYEAVIVILVAVVAYAATWFTRNKVGSVSRKR